MKQAAFLLLLILITITGFSQTKISSYEYWYDNNYTGKVVKTVIPVTILILDTGVNASNLSYGLHTFNIRFKDNNTRYSPVKSAYFYKSGYTITGYEYWIDGDYNKKVAKSVTASSFVSITLDIDLAALNVGLHQVSIRFKDEAGIWSSVKSSYFTRVSQTITAYEYWFDNNYSNKISKTLPPSQTVILDTGLNGNAFATGLHQFNIRFKGEGESWSSSAAFYFYKAAYKILAYEYWFDDDYANKIAQVASSSSSTFILNTSVNIGGNTSGSHLLNFRFKDDAGSWSSPLSKYFYQIPKDEDKDGLPNSIEFARYGTDTTNLDTNNDLLADGVNVFTGLPPLSADTDGDGISNLQEILNGTNPVLWDTDFDNVPDKSDPFPLDRFRTKLPPTNANDHTKPAITLSEPF